MKATVEKNQQEQINRIIIHTSDNTRYCIAEVNGFLVISKAGNMNDAIIIKPKSENRIEII